MTPYALELLRAGFEHTKGTAEAWNADALGLVAQVAAAQAFECSGVQELADEFGGHHFPHHVNLDLMFLPAPIVWLEYLPRWAGKDQRVGYLLKQDGSPKRAKLSVFVKERDRSAAIWNSRLFIDILSFDLGTTVPQADSWVGGPVVRPEAMIAGLLTIINQPSGVLRQDQAVHRGLERRFRALGLLGGVTLRPWTRLVLDRPGRPKMVAGAHIEGIVGRKCYHFVRAHWREANGQFVKAHWRGDPALGIGRKTYAVRTA